MQNTINQIIKINWHYKQFDTYLQTYDKGFSSTASSTSINAAVQKIKWTLKEPNNKIARLKLAVTEPLL